MRVNTKPLLLSLLLAALTVLPPSAAPYFAINITKLTESESATSSGVATTASVTTTTNALNLVWITGRATSKPATSNACSMTGHSLTWAEVTQAQSANVFSTRWGSLFRSMGTGTSGTLTLTCPADTQSITWVVFSITGVITGNNGADALGTPAADGGEAAAPPGTVTITVTGTPSAGDIYLDFLAMEDGMNGGSAGTLTEEGGHTNVTTFYGTMETGHDVMFSGSDSTPEWGGFNNNRFWAAAGLIVKASASSPAAPRKLLLLGVGDEGKVY